MYAPADIAVNNVALTYTDTPDVPTNNNPYYSVDPRYIECDLLIQATYGLHGCWTPVGEDNCDNYVPMCRISMGNAHIYLHGAIFVVPNHVKSVHIISIKYAAGYANRVMLIGREMPDRDHHTIISDSAFLNIMCDFVDVWQGLKKSIDIAAADYIAAVVALAAKTGFLFSRDHNVAKLAARIGASRLLIDAYADRVRLINKHAIKDARVVRAYRDVCVITDK